MATADPARKTSPYVKLEDFHRTGYAGPFTLCSPEDMAVLRRYIDTEVLATRGPNPRLPVQSRHLDRRPLYDLLAHPAVVDRLTRLLGTDIVLWTSYFFDKRPGGHEVPWHQDANYWQLEPPLNISAWIAVDEVTRENSCVQLIPGSHRRLVPHVPAREGIVYGEEADPAFVDDTTAVDMELAPGQFFLFNERLLHHSEPNRSARRRLGLAGRYTVPLVKILDQDIRPLFPGHHCVMVSGQDTMGLNRVGPPPARLG